MIKHKTGLPVIIIAVACLLILPGPGHCFPLTITDASGRPVTLDRPPRRAVSLVPSITEIIRALEAGKTLKGITCHDADSTSDNTGIVIVGGFAHPDADIIAALDPDIIFISDIHQAIKDRFSDSPCPVIYYKINTIADSLETIHRLGLIFNKKEKAEAIVAAIRADLELIDRKTALIPENKKQRVIRLMGEKTAVTPGADSFQNEMIRAAGGISHAVDQNGAAIPVSKEQWLNFDPQVIYGCNGTGRASEAFFNLPGWNEVSAVKNGRIFSFPCDLTCRAATRTGNFVSWLAATIYTDSFSDIDNLVLKEGVLKAENLPEAGAMPGYIKKSQIVRSRIYDFVHKSLVLDFTKPVTVLSSLEGWRDSIKTVGNHFFPPPCWSICHQIGLDEFQGHVLKALGRDKTDTAFLFTGADMDNLSVRQAGYRDLTVWAGVTAGVTSNALRASKDQGLFYEPGTINIILLAEPPLSRQAMTRAIITATEAKTAALLDLDIRSSQNQGRYRATGTGTDNIIVIQGPGEKPLLDNAGGHSRLGQLIAEAVYAGVREAVEKQNHLNEKRSVFQRLEERHISPYDFIDPDACECHRPQSEITAELETVLLDPVYAGFLETSFSLSDDNEKGLVTDLTAFHFMALDICSRLAEKEITRINDHISREDLPVVIETALNALLTGIYQRQPENR